MCCTPAEPIRDERLPWCPLHPSHRSAVAPVQGSGVCDGFRGGEVEWGQGRQAMRKFSVQPFESKNAAGAKFSPGCTDGRREAGGGGGEASSLPHFPPFQAVVVGAGGCFIMFREEMALLLWEP